MSLNQTIRTRDHTHTHKREFPQDSHARRREEYQIKRELVSMKDISLISNNLADSLIG